KERTCEADGARAGLTETLRRTAGPPERRGDANPAAAATRSCVARRRAEHAGVDAQKQERLAVSLRDRRVEDDAGLGGDVDPAVAAHFFLELAGRPAAVAERHEHPLRPRAAGKRLQHVLARRHLEAALDLQRRVVAGFFLAARAR